MAVQTSYPGVYVQEVPSGVRTIAGVSTSITLFVGNSLAGPINQPILCLNYSDFDRTFSSDTTHGDLPRSVQLFFLNGGTQCYVNRIDYGATAAAITLQNSGSNDALIITAYSAGTAGNNIKVVVTAADSGAPSNAFTIAITSGTTSQTWKNVTLDPASQRYVLSMVNNSLVQLTLPATTPDPTLALSATNSTLSGGADDDSSLTNAAALTAYKTAYGIIAKEVDLFNLMVLARNSTGPLPNALYGDAAAILCQKKRAFLLLDPENSWTTVQNAITNITDLRNDPKDYQAVFYPRLKLNDGLNTLVGPSGAIAGLIARIDANRGVWKAPAGTEAELRGISGLEYKFTDEDNGVLNPRGINTIRIFPDGIVNWGARTIDGDDDFGSEYKYIPVRRTALFIEESLYRGLKWVVFEPNDEPLWAQVRLNVGAFMQDLFRQGAFQGKTKQDAYFVKCDSETTTQNDINLGVVNVWVGFAPLKPAEFVVLYLQQMAGQIQV